MDLNQDVSPTTAVARVLSIKKTAIATLGARLITVFAQIITVSVALDYLGANRYGIWMTIASIVSFLHLSDLGIGNALIGFIAEKHATNDHYSLLSFVKKALAILCLGALLVFFAGYVTVNVYDWRTLLSNNQAITAAELKNSILVFLGLFCLGQPLGASQQMRLGLQSGHINAVYNSIGQIMNLLAIYIAVELKGNLPTLIFASMIGTLLLNFFNLVSLMVSLKYKQGCNVISRPIETRLLFRRAAAFFLLHISGLIAYQSDILIVSYFHSSAAVSEYSIVLKYFSIPSVFLSFFFVGMWPAYSDALMRQEKIWVESFFWKSMRYSLAANAVICIFLFVSAKPLVAIWTKGRITPDSWLLTAMALWSFSTAIGGSLATLLNGMNVLKFQIVVSFLSALVNFVISVKLAQLVGISGPVWGSLITSLIFYSYMMWYVIRIFKRGDNVNNKE